MNDTRKFFLEADIKIEEETDNLKKAVAAAINLPNVNEKQPDLLYFSAVFVSTGTNLNMAHFLPSELIKAADTVVSKALDVEHKEGEIIGHIYDSVFIDSAGNKLDVLLLKEKEESDLNSELKNMHIIIAGVVYKNRFPGLAKEMANNEWKVSMECYYGDYDIKIGDVILTRKEAEVLGLAHDDRLFGKLVKILKEGKEKTSGAVERVLRNIIFSGCGIVKNPANPPSVILETANKKDDEKETIKDIIVLDYDKLEKEFNSVNNPILDNNKVTSDSIENNNIVITSTNSEDSELEYDDSVGICVSFKKKIFSEQTVGPNTQIVHENWCTLYNVLCSSFSRDTTDPDCLRNKVKEVVNNKANKLFNKYNKNNKIEYLLSELEAALDKINIPLN